MPYLWGVSRRHSNLRNLKPHEGLSAVCDVQSGQLLPSAHLLMPQLIHKCILRLQEAACGGGCGVRGAAGPPDGVCTRVPHPRHYPAGRQEVGSVPARQLFPFMLCRCTGSFGCPHRLMDSTQQHHSRVLPALCLFDRNHQSVHRVLTKICRLFQNHVYPGCSQC